MRYLLGLFVSLLATMPLAAQPAILTPFAVNAASYSLGLPNSAIAQGSLFTVFGNNLGPAAIVSAPSFPLQKALAGTSALVAVNGVTVSPLMIFTLASQVAMLMPSSTPIGSGTITITYNGQTSPPVPVQVAAANFGIFTLNQGGSGPAIVTDANGAVISLTHPASPGQQLVVWGTGLGGIATDESMPPLQGRVGTQPTVWVGSQTAGISYWGRSGGYAGLDQINFQVPEGASGCYVPVAVQTGATISNFGSIAVAGGGALCSDPDGLGPAQLTQVQNGQNLNVATMELSRTIVSRDVPPPAAATSTTTDAGSASFLSYTPDQLRSSTFGQEVSEGNCMVFPISGVPTVIDPVRPVGLDAGPSVEVGGINGSVVLAMSSPGYYSASLGSTASPPLFLDVPGHTFNVFGGADVGDIAQELQMPLAMNWTNQDSISTVKQSEGVTVNWTNGPTNGHVRVTGYSLSIDTNGNLGAGASFACTALAESNGNGQFFVPPFVLMSLPVTAAGAAMPSGFLGVSSIQTPSDAFNIARGIDAGFAQATVTIMKNVTYSQ